MPSPSTIKAAIMALDAAKTALCGISSEVYSETYGNNSLNKEGPYTINIQVKSESTGLIAFDIPIGCFISAAQHVLTEGQINKIEAIKKLRNGTPYIGLREAKDIVETIEKYMMMYRMSEPLHSA